MPGDSLTGKPDTFADDGSGQMKLTITCSPGTSCYISEAPAADVVERLARRVKQVEELWNVIHRHIADLHQAEMELSRLRKALNTIGSVWSDSLLPIPESVPVSLAYTPRPHDKPHIGDIASAGPGSCGCWEAEMTCGCHSHDENHQKDWDSFSGY